MSGLAEALITGSNWQSRAVRSLSLIPLWAGAMMIRYGFVRLIIDTPLENKGVQMGEELSTFMVPFASLIFETAWLPKD